MIDIEVKKQEVDKELLRKRFRCASKTYDAHAVVQKNMAAELVRVASNHIPANPYRMAELGCGTGLLTQQVIQYFQGKEYIANDLVAEVEEDIKRIVQTQPSMSLEFIQGDAENIHIATKQNIIWSGATIQWIEDLDTFFNRLSHSLNKNGYLAFSSFDTDNYKEVRTITGKGIDYKTMDEVLRYASTYFKVLDKKTWKQQMMFKSPKEVLKHMRYTGVNAVSNTKWGKGDLERFILDYEMFKKEQGYPLTYHPFVIILQKK